MNLKHDLVAVIVPVILTLAPVVVFAGDDVQKDQQSASSFVNATSDSKPREISLGLPTSILGTVHIYEDGLPVSYNIYHLYPYKSWHGGASAESSGNYGPMDAALLQTEINYYVNGWNRTGATDRTRGTVSFTGGQYGQHKIDLNVNGPIGNGWTYSLSTYQNLDPGSNRLLFTRYKDRHQFYKGVIARNFRNGHGKMWLVGQYVDYRNVSENYALFNFVGDGTVTEIDGFRIGHNQYLPADETFTYMDVKDGLVKTENYTDNMGDRSTHLTFNLQYRLSERLDLEFHSRRKYATTKNVSRRPYGISDITSDDGYTYADGTPFEGMMETRQLIRYEALENSWMNSIRLKGKTERTVWNAGVNFQMAKRRDYTSSASSNHEVCSDPKQLYLNGEAFHNFNTSGEYYDGVETKTAPFVKLDWTITDRLSTTGFANIEIFTIDGKTANNNDEVSTNTRRPGFNLTQATITGLDKTFLNRSFGDNLTYRLTGKLSASAEGVVTVRHNNLFNYGGATDPGDKPFTTKLLRGGLSYTGRELNISLQAVCISQDNRSSRQSFAHTLTKDAGGMPKGSTETVLMPIVYSISSLGMVADAIWNPTGGFNLHSQLMLRNPKYRDFTLQPTFSDGVTENHDFSGNYVTAMSRLELTLDPSYSFDRWDLSLTARYMSREYVNKTNSLYFSGRLETFGSASFRLNEKVKFSLNVINLLNQKGASGSIYSADLVTKGDAYRFRNYIMAGTYIRPFTVELGININI